MKLKILGKYGPFSVNGKCTSSYLLINNDNLALLDLGSGTVSKFLKDFNIENLKFVFLSHLHYDHISDFGVLSYAITFLRKQNKKINLYLPKHDCKILEILKGIDAFNLIYIEENKPYVEGSFSFSFYKTEHPVLSYGISVRAGDKTFAYSGDSSSTFNFDLLTKNADLFLCDGAFLEKDYNDKKPHLSIKKVCEYAESKNIKTIITHQNYLYNDEAVLSEIKRFSKLCEMAIEDKEYLI